MKNILKAWNYEEITRHFLQNNDPAPLSFIYDVVPVSMNKRAEVVRVKLISTGFMRYVTVKKNEALCVYDDGSYGVVSNNLEGDR